VAQPGGLTFCFALRLVLVRPIPHWRIQKIVLGGGGEGAVPPAGVQGAEPPLEGLGKAPRSWSMNPFWVMVKAFS